MVAIRKPAIGLAAALALGGMGLGAAQAQPIVQTAYGAVQGFTSAGINSFLGIPYAAPPVGALRWAPPVNPAPFTQTFQATQYSAYCPQGFSELGTGGGSEDCLYLNMQVPATATPTSKLPVMVWIHGGGLSTGSGSEYDGSALAKEGNVVFVSLNYRLGLLGFFAHPALAAENTHGISGNYGLLDQQAAIAYVRQNIAAFGGDPSRITIFGESAGGQSTIDQLVSPLVGPLHAAIIESGAYARALPTGALEQQLGTTLAASTAIGCSSQTAACLRAVSATTLVAAASTSATSPGFYPTPNVDGYVLPTEPFQAFATGQFQRIPIIDGTNHDEYRLFVSENEILSGDPVDGPDYVNGVQALFGSLANGVLGQYPLFSYINPGYALAAVGTDYGFTCGAVLLDALISTYAPLYAYEFNDVNVPNIFLPLDPNMTSLGDSHAAELPYLFPQFRNPELGLGPAVFTTSQQYLATGMRASWTSLARYGRPLNPRGGPWFSYSVANHNFASLISPAPKTTYGLFADHKCAFWRPLMVFQAGLPSGTQY